MDLPIENFSITTCLFIAENCIMAGFFSFSSRFRESAGIIIRISKFHNQIFI